MRTQHQDIRRRLDGSIDIDFYRERGLVERRIVMTGFFKRFGQVVKPLAAVALIAATLCAASSRDGTGWVAPTASVAGPNKVSPSLPDDRSAARRTERRALIRSPKIPLPCRTQ